MTLYYFPEMTPFVGIRLRTDPFGARKWAAGKLNPKKYGERLDLKHGGNVLPAVTYIMKLHPKDD